MVSKPPIPEPTLTPTLSFSLSSKSANPESSTANFAAATPY